MTRVDDHDGCDNEEEKENHGSNHFSNSVMFEGMGTPCWPISMNQKTGIYKQILYILRKLGYKQESTKELQWVMGPNGETCYR